MADFNMDAPASGCASDLSRRSYDPLSTDNAAASYRAIVVGDLPIPPRSALEAIAVAAKLVQAERRGAPSSLSLSRYIDGYNSPRRFLRRWFTSPRLCRRCHAAIWPADRLSPRYRGCDPASIRDGNWFRYNPAVQIYIRGYDTRG